MSRHRWRSRHTLLGLLVLLTLVGCAVEHGKVYVKDGKRYGVTSRHTWRGRWWDHYERGVSYTDGAFWDDAAGDFQAAIKQNPNDERRAWTYGMHFMDYFPHRELGIVYYHLGRYSEAVLELKTSMASIETAKAKFYLNKARAARLQQSGRDTTPPRIVLEGPPDGLLTNRFSVTVSGRVEDDTYVAAVAVNNEAQFIELAEPRLTFRQDVSLHDGTNTIDIVAQDLTGRQTRSRMTVHLDRHGPLVSLDQAEIVGTPPRVRVTGRLQDHSRITRFVLAGQPMPLQPGTAWEFRHELPVTAGTLSLPFEVEDAAGNTTRGDISLTPSIGAPGTREGRATGRLLPRWAFLHPGRVMSDLPDMRYALLGRRQPLDRQPPTITLPGLSDQETIYDDTIYVEGEVADTGLITAFTINGVPRLRQPTQQLFFGWNVALQTGENRITLEAVDEAGNVAQRELVITRKIRKVRQVGSRLRLVLLPLVQQGQASVLTETTYTYLLNAFIRQQRFEFIERRRLDEVLEELRLSAEKLVIDPQAAARAGRIATAEGLLAGTVTETPKSLEVTARLVDVETAVNLMTEDVYGEDMSLRSVKTLMQGLAWKFQRHFPLVEGSIMEKQGKRLLTDLAAGDGIRRYMRLLIFRPGETFTNPHTGRVLRRPDTILGEAQITAVTPDLSEATVLSSEQSGDVRESDRVITK